MSHFLIKCRMCGVRISGCRCIHIETGPKVEYDTCAACKTTAVTAPGKVDELPTPGQLLNALGDKDRSVFNAIRGLIVKALRESFTGKAVYVTCDVWPNDRAIRMLQEHFGRAGWALAPSSNPRNERTLMIAAAPTSVLSNCDCGWTQLGWHSSCSKCGSSSQMSYGT